MAQGQDSQRGGCKPHPDLDIDPVQYQVLNGGGVVVIVVAVRVQNGPRWFRPRCWDIG